MGLVVLPLGNHYRIQDSTTNNTIYDPTDYNLDLSLEQMENLCNCFDSYTNQYSTEAVYSRGYDDGFAEGYDCADNNW